MVKNMKKIICYGDSNTFGFNPKDGSKYDDDIIWTFQLQKILKDKYVVINEGMCDRTGFVNNPNGFMFSGPKHFPKLIAKSDEIDVLILWIGINDLQFQYDISMNSIEKGLENLIQIAKSKAKNIIIVAPVILNEQILEGFFKCKFDKTSIIKSRKVGRIFRMLANVYYLGFLDLNKFVKPSIDGLHYDAASHKIIAEKFAEYINNYYC